MLVSARGDYLVEMEARDAKSRAKGQRRAAAERASRTADSHEADGAGDRGVLRLELSAPELRAIFRGLDRRQKNGQNEGRMEGLLAPDRRVELCR